MTRPPAPRTPTDPGWPSLLLLLSGTFLVVLDFFIVNVALPSIQHDFAATDAALQFVVAGYGLANAVGLVMGGRLGDLFGRRRMFLSGLALFTLASAACGLAPGIGALNAARVVQGLAGALLQPQVLAMLGLVFTGEARARAFGAYGVTLGLGAVLGQLIGGLLIHADLGGARWRACFLINLPVGALGVMLGRRVLPALAATGRSRLDLAGAGLLGLALAAWLWPLIEGRQAGWPVWSVAMLAAALPLFALFVGHQRRTEARGGQPLVPPSLLRVPGFRTGLAVAMAFYAGNASFYFVLALHLQHTLGLGALASGSVFTALAVGFFATTMAAAPIGRRFGVRAIGAGAGLLALGHVALIAVCLASGIEDVSASVAWMVPVLLIEGAGIGLVMAPLTSTVLAFAPPALSGVAAGALATVMQVGNSLGVALIGLAYHAAGLAPTQAFAAAMAYLVVLAVAVAVLVRGWVRGPVPRRPAAVVR